MRFREGDKAEFVYGGKLTKGVVTEIKASPFGISYLMTFDENNKTIWVVEYLLLSPAQVLKVPQFVADWIEQKKANGDQLYIAMDNSWQSMNYKVSDWLGEGEGR